jgi:lipopolysaccharide/colanic/teichoic acid biosynthesis glycosyltransferase
VAIRYSIGTDYLQIGLLSSLYSDELSVPEKVGLDTEYLRNKSFLFDYMIVFKAISVLFHSEGLSH